MEKDVYLKNKTKWNNQQNIYAIYHNPIVNVIMDNKDMPLLDNKKTAFYVFENDEIKPNEVVKAMRFSEFYDLLKSIGAKYFVYQKSGTEFKFHIDAYKAFTKDELDKFLKLNPKQKDQYSFLFE